MNIGDTTTALTNTTLIIHCPVSGFPRPKIVWFKDGQQLTFLPGLSLSVNGTLTVRGTAVGDSGTYMCTARNLVGNASASSDVTIVGK